MKIAAFILSYTTRKQLVIYLCYRDIKTSFLEHEVISPQAVKKYVMEK